MTEASNQQEINLFQLSLEQLNSLKGQHEEEIQQLNRQAETLLGARNRFLTTRATLQQLNQGKEGDQLLVPLNSSLYVPGTMVTPQKVVVELGTGYYCEKEVPAALELIDRKTQLVNKSIETVDNFSTQKRRTLDQVVQIMQYKISMLQQQQQEAKK